MNEKSNLTSNALGCLDGRARNRKAGQRARAVGVVPLLVLGLLTPCLAALGCSSSSAEDDEREGGTGGTASSTPMGGSASDSGGSMSAAGKGGAADGTGGKPTTGEDSGGAGAWEGGETGNGGDPGAGGTLEPGAGGAGGGALGGTTGIGGGKPTSTEREQPEAPEGCSEKSFKGNVDAKLDIDIEQLEGFTTLEGNLSLSGMVTDLTPLGCLTSVTGNVSLTNLGELQVVALPSLTDVGGRFYVGSNGKIEEIWLSRLSTIGSYDGLSLLADTLPELVVFSVPKLREAPSHVQLTNLGATTEEPLFLDLGALEIVRGSFQLRGASNLENLYGLTALTTIGGNLQISSNTTLEWTDGLANVREVGGRVAIDGNPALKSIALSSLVTLAEYDGYSLLFDALPELVYLEVDQLEEANRNVQLTGIGATADGPLTLSADSLSIVRGSLILRSVANLEALDGLSALTTVAGELQIASCEKLVDASGLRQLEEVGARLNLNSNTVLAKIDLSSLTKLGQYDGFSLLFDRLPELVSVRAGNLAETPQNLQISSCGSTAEAPLELDFGSLAIVRGHLDLVRLANLEDLDGFAALELLGGNLQVSSNPGLTDIGGLDALAEVGGNLTIQSNAVLPTCDVLALRNRLVDLGFMGTTNSSANQDPNANCD